MKALTIAVLAAAIALAACETKETKVYQQSPPPQPAPTYVVPAPTY
jgi:outer membrane protein assembly factor BamE (lipoprotein component of BamABCDE complex)